MDGIGFWIAAGGMGLAVSALLVLALWRGRTGADDPAAAYDLRVYRDQLRDIDRDVARGIIATEDAERLRSEIARRALDADRALTTGTHLLATPAAARHAGTALIVLTLIAGSFVIYRDIGAPGYPDLPLVQRIAMADERRENRPAQALAEAGDAAASPALPDGTDPRHLDLVAQLRAVVAERPADLQGQELLARNEAVIGNFAGAHRAQAAVIALKGPVATAADYQALAELMIRAAGGYVSPEAETALTEVLRREPRNQFARYFSGEMFAQVGRFDMAFRFWKPLLEESSPSDPWFASLRANLPGVAARAGALNFELPAVPADRPARGPDAADIEAAGDMSEEERAGMVRGMVAGLNQRLATEGGTAEDWARLIRAYGVLGETGSATSIWTETKAVFAGRDGDLALLRAAAETAGVGYGSGPATAPAPATGTTP